MKVTSGLFSAFKINSDFQSKLMLDSEVESETHKKELGSCKKSSKEDIGWNRKLRSSSSCRSTQERH